MFYDITRAIIHSFTFQLLISHDMYYLTTSLLYPLDVVVNKANEVFMTNFSDGTCSVDLDADGNCPGANFNLCENQLIRFSADDAHKKAMKDSMNCVKADKVQRFKAINIGENCQPGTNNCESASGLDAHVGTPDSDDRFVYLPTQKANGALNGPAFGRLAVYDTKNLKFKSEQDLGLAHGICFAADDSKVLVTSIGSGMVTEFDTVDDDGILGPPGIAGTVPQAVLDQGAGKAHNIIKTPKGEFMYI